MIHKIQFLGTITGVNLVIGKLVRHFKQTDPIKWPAGAFLKCIGPLHYLAVEQFSKIAAVAHIVGGIGEVFK